MTKSGWLTWGLSVFIFVLNGGALSSPDSVQVVHAVQISHPGKADFLPVEESLVEVKDLSGNPAAYYMDVVSVYCDDSVCKVVPVRLLWDNIGQFERFHLDENVFLEKIGGEPFLPSDYDKLQRILSDPNSPFKNIRIDELSAPSTEEDVDAYSSATTLFLPEEATVQGASLTCYTLWHWANGPVCSIIRDLTGNLVSIETLKSWLLSGETNRKIFALHYLLSRAEYHQETVSRVLDLMVQDEPLFLKPGFEYLADAPSDLYYNAVEKLYNQGGGLLRSECLRSLQRRNDIPPNGYFERLGERLLEVVTYQEVDLFLSIIQKYERVSEPILQQVMTLLDKDILVARRAYWFLKDQPLTPKQDKRIKVFVRKNRDYL